MTKTSKSSKKTKPNSMEALLALLPDTGITHGKASNEGADYVAAHPDTWTPIVLPKRGRPIRGQETGSKVRSVRFSDEHWAQIEEKAQRMNLPLHAAMRQAILEWAQSPVDTAPVPTVVVASAQSPLTNVTRKRALSPIPATGPVHSFRQHNKSNSRNYSKFVDLTKV
jgi:hypothetical protein